MYDLAFTLESYTIPEYEIATEGLFQAAGNLIIRVLKAISTKLGAVIGIVVGLIVALKGKMNKKPETVSTESGVIPELTRALVPYTNSIIYIGVVSKKITQNIAVSGVDEFVSEVKKKGPLSKEEMAEQEKFLTDADIRSELNEFLEIRKQFDSTYDDLISKKKAFLGVQRKYPNGKISSNVDLIKKAATSKRRIEEMKNGVEHAIKQIFSAINIGYQNASNRVKNAVANLQKEIGSLSGLIGKFIAEVTEYTNIVKKVL